MKKMGMGGVGKMSNGPKNIDKGKPSDAAKSLESQNAAHLKQGHKKIAVPNWMDAGTDKQMEMPKKSKMGAFSKKKGKMDKDGDYDGDM